MEMNIELREIDFSQIATKKKKCCYISGETGKAVVNYIELYSLELLTGSPMCRGFFLQVQHSGQDDAMYKMFVDYGFVCRPAFPVSGWSMLLDLTEGARRFPYRTYEKEKKRVVRAVSENSHVSILDIRIAALAGEPQPFVQSLQDYWQKRCEERKARRKEEEKMRQLQKERDFLKAREDFNKWLFQKEQDIKDHKSVENEKISVPSRVDYTLNTCLFLHLLRKYNVDVPLRTQGWIHKCLKEVQFHENGTTYRYAGKQSAKAFSCLCDLAAKIREEEAVA